MFGIEKDRDKAVVFVVDDMEINRIVLEEIIRQGCFGGEKGGIPEVKSALLGDQAGMIGAASLI